MHSFTGTVEEVEEIMALGLFVGLNGCSFKTAENCAVVRAVRLDRMMLETDGPWCEVRPSHEGWRYLVEVEKAEREVAEASRAVEEQQQRHSEVQPESAKTVVEPAGPDDDGEPRPQRPKKQKQPQASKKQPAKKESEVTERFKSVKKEKWVAGAMVKSRNEPCSIERVAKIVAGIKGVSVEEVCEAAWRNTVRVFGLGEE